jgi:hypothetical protein
MSSFKISGNKTMLRFWKGVSNIATEKIKKNSDVQVDINTIILPTASTLIIKFTILNTGKKYELVKQGKYADIYKLQSDGNNITPEDVNAEIIIRSSISEAWEIN